MITIPISQDEIEQAKTITKEFDSIKGHNKFVCSNNYIGVLGEIVLNRYMKYNNIEHEWVQFMYKDKGYNDPDFIINKFTIDLKTTFSDSMWYQKPQHDIYIYAQITEDIKFLLVKAWMPKEMLVNNTQVKHITRGNRVDNVISNENMLPISMLVGMFPPAHSII